MAISRLVCAAAAACVVALASAEANAQILPSVDARTWRPSTDPNASLVIEPAVTPGPGVFTFGAYAHYSHLPITLRRAGTDEVRLRPLRHVLGIDPFVNLG